MKLLNTLGLISLVILAGLAISSFTESRKDTPEIVQVTLPMWEMAKTHTLEVLDAMPEDKFDYAPSDKSKTFASQMVHIGYTLQFFNERMLQGKEIQYQEPESAGMSKAEIRTMLETNFDAIMTTVKGLSEEALQKTMPFGPDKQISVAQVILFAHDHTTNHRAKANLYIRMNDLEPPSYKFQ